MYYSNGGKMYRYPSNRTIMRLKKMGYKGIIWLNGDFILF